MQVLIAGNYDDLSQKAARLVADAVRAKPQLVLCLATGKTPLGMYRELIRIHRESRLDFSRVSFLQLDEYVGLRPDHPQSFRALLWRAFLNYVNVRRANVYPPGEAYEETIRRIGGIDLLISGIGVNGHIAFNEPGSSHESLTRIVDLDTLTLDSMRGNFLPQDLPRQAITVGLQTILHSRWVLLLASGKSKADVLARALKGSITPDVPASFLQEHPNLVVIADKEAAEVYQSASHI